MSIRNAAVATLGLLVALISYSCASSRSPDSPAPTQEEMQRGSIESHLLAGVPLCEPSAALVAPWDDDLVLVADNELDEQLFTFEIDGDKLVPDVTMAMPGGKRPRDLEALAKVGDSLLAVGSHSRNTRCEERTNRQRMRLLERRDDGSLKEERLIDSKKAWQEAMAGEDECLETLFVDPPPELAMTACRALLAAEETARSGGSCPVLNIEGAFGKKKRVWLGLRAPVVEGSAALFRLTSDLDELRFDRVVLLALDGRGIRELTRDDDTLYGIAGPEEDATDPFALFSADLDEILAGGRFVPEILRSDLPTSSEGMFVRDGHAYVSVDGDGGDDPAVCARAGRQYRIELE